MVVRIRLARFGKRHSPFYNIVVSQARAARDSKPMEVLGTYDPKPKPALDGGRAFKDIKLDVARTKYWLGVGAQPSDPARGLLSRLGLIEPKLALLQAREAAAKADARHRLAAKSQPADGPASAKSTDS